MQRTLMIAIVVAGITTARAQTALLANGQTTGSQSTTNSQGNVGSDPLSVPTSSAPTLLSPSLGSSAAASGSGSTTTNGSAGGGQGGANASASSSSQAPLLLPGEIPDTSTQAASTTAATPGSVSPVCPPPVPSSDGGSANLSEIAGVSLNGC
jgi:hypothetical protein